MRNLAVFSHKLFRRTSGGLQTAGGFTVMIEALAPYFEQVVLCVPVVDDAEFRGVGIAEPNVRFHPLPHYQGRLGFLRTMPAMRREILAVMRRAEMALVSMPGYVGTLASILCQRHRFPTFQLVMGDWGRNVQVRRSNALARWLASAIWGPVLDQLMARLTRDVLTFFDGHVLYRQGNPYHFTFVSSTVHRDDLYIRDGTLRLPPPHRLLFVGRLAALKGISHLLGATALLAAQGAAVELHIVGTGALESDLRCAAQALNITGQVIFHGFVPHGEALRQIYRESDVFILPSLQDQQPKVLLEAMSQSVPVIATKVGGIPCAIHDGENGLLVPPAQPEAIAAAIHRVLSDGELRRKLVRGGLAHARAHSVEQETERMMQVVARHFNMKGMADGASS
jgi:glycosyltransferase involved in cell wall biosynthesis